MNDATHLGHLIDRQVSLWDARKREHVDARPHVGGKLEHAPQGPWITISTQLGSGGVELASRLGARLGWQVYDKQIVEEIAKSTHTKEKILSRLDGHAVSAFEDYVIHLFVPGHPGRSAYALEMMRVMWAIARHGQAILVGRGANWLLDPRFGLRLRAVASVEKRVERLMEKERLSASAARRRVDDDSADRAKFVRQTFKQEIDDPLGYDLVVNLGTLGFGPAVELAAAAFAAKMEADASVPSL